MAAATGAWRARPISEGEYGRPIPTGVQSEPTTAARGVTTRSSIGGRKQALTLPLGEPPAFTA
jgi:hypothetical protein